MQNTFAVVSRSQLSHIKSKVGPASDIEQLREEERLRLREKSLARASKWDNTLDGQRAKKQKEKEEKQRKEEAERALIDREEAVYQAEQRKQSIERANKLLYQEDDRVKNFNSKILLSEVLRERNQQVNTTVKKKEYEQMADEQWRAYQEEQSKKQQEHRIRLLEDERQRAIDIRNEQKKQMQELVDQRRTMISQQQLERELIDRRTKEEQEREQTKLMEKRKKDIEYAKDHLVHHEKIKERGEKDKHKENETERTAQEFVSARDQRMSEHKRREKQRFEEQLAVKQKLIDRQAKMIRDTRSEEEERLRKQQDEIQERARLAEEKARNRKQILMEQVKDSRTRQLKSKDTITRRELDEKEQFNEQWKTRNEILALEDAFEKEQLRDMQKNVQDFQKLQIREKKKLEREDLRKKKREAALMKRAIQHDQERFKQYVKEAHVEYEDVPEPIAVYNRKHKLEI
jgi:hypothetical protein